MSLKQRKITFEPIIKFNHNIDIEYVLHTGFFLVCVGVDTEISTR